MAEIKWPEPTAYVVWQAMAEDYLSWARETKALSNTPLYTKEQVHQMLAAIGAVSDAPKAEWDGSCVLGHCGSPSGCERDDRCRADPTHGLKETP